MATSGGRHGSSSSTSNNNSNAQQNPKDCRACTDFKSWTKMQMGAIGNQKDKATEEVFQFYSHKRSLAFTCRSDDLCRPIGFVT